LAAFERLLAILIAFLLFFLRLLLRLFRGREEENKTRHCLEIPPHVKRKPDPCLYSQFYLMALGIAVTWDNPDIQITLPDNTPVPSHDLAANTQYVVHATIHNASFNPAIGTEVRCFYRPWSFNDPSRTPVEINPDGTEKVIILHIPAWGSRIAKFNWRTPNVADAHFCLQVECQHPDDANPNNNLGQENTNVHSAKPGEKVSIKTLLLNPHREPRRIRFRADAYEIPGEEIMLKLNTRTRTIGGISRFLLTREARSRKLMAASRRAPQLIAYVYRGIEELRKRNLRDSQRLSPEWVVRRDGNELEAALALDAGKHQEVTLEVTTPPNATPGRRQRINIVAFDDRGRNAGGVTLVIKIV
jgi:hypothetical protein